MEETQFVGTMGRTALSFLGDTWNMRFVKMFKVFTSYINFARDGSSSDHQTMCRISHIYLRTGFCYFPQTRMKMSIILFSQY